MIFALGVFGEGVRVEVARKVFDGGDEARSGAIDGIADRGVTTIANSVQQAPAGKVGKSLGAMRRSTEMRLHKNQKFRLKTDNFLEVDLGPVARGIDDRYRACVEQRIRNEWIFADGDERLGPNGEEHSAVRRASEGL